jgi:hypothetical protein
MRALRALGYGAPSALLLLQGCGEPDVVCDARRPTTHALHESLTASRHGSGILGARPSTFRTTLFLELTQLPSIWSLPATVDDAQASVVYSLAYEGSEPVNAEFPEITVDAYIGSGTGGRPIRLRAATRATLQLDLFRVCRREDPSPECCEPGEATCSVQIALTASRADALFPDVVVTWDASASVTVASCIASAEPPALHMTEVGP